jgi:hypothetical protein
VSAEVDWTAKCDGDGMLTELTFAVRALRNVTYERYHPQLDTRLTAPLLLFTELTQLDLLVFGGELPPQLGSLSKLQFLNVSHYCLGGTLPPNWLDGWKESLLKLNVAPHQDAFGLVPEDAECGLTGPIPLRWQQTTMEQLFTLQLNNNRLSGFLPSLENWKHCCSDLKLGGNEFVGPVPQRWSVRSLANVMLENNKLEGERMQMAKHFAGQHCVRIALFEQPHVTLLQCAYCSIMLQFDAAASRAAAELGIADAAHKAHYVCTH